MMRRTTKISHKLLGATILAGAAMVVPTGSAAAQFGSEAAEDADSNVIIVTARKREESLLEAPVSVSAFSQDDLDQAGVNALDDLSAQAPGFQFVAGANGGAGRGNSDIRFRGLSSRATDPSNRPGAIFWDGGYMSHGVGVLPLIDLERVEVIKGPQTAFFGRNTFSGAVNFIPKEPGDEFSGKVQASYEFANEDGYNITAALGGPLTETFGIRVAGVYEKVGADWEFRNGDPLGQEKNAGGTIVMTWKPVPDLKIKASGVLVSAEDTHLLQGQLAPVAPGQCDRTFTGQFAQIADRSITRPYSTDLSLQNRFMFCGEMPDFDDLAPTVSAFGRITETSPLSSQFNSYGTIAALPQELSGISIIPKVPSSLGSTYRLWRTNLGADYDLAGGHTLSALFSYGESASRNVSDGNHGFGDLPRLSTLIRAVSDTYGEIRFTSDQDGRLRYTLGASIYRQRNLTGFVVGTWRITDQSAENFGIFGSVDFDITDRLTASLEGRWHDDKLTVDFSGVSGSTPATSPATIVDQSQSYDAFMPRAILDYEIIDDMHIYGSWSESRLQGTATGAATFFAEVGIDLGLGTFTPPQKNTTFEVGLKQQVGWFNYSIAAYYTKWKNQVFGDGAFNATGNFFGVSIAGETEVKGIDVEFLASPTPWLDFSGGFSYNDVEFVDSAATGSITGILSSGANPPRIRSGPDAEIISVAGNRPRSTPEWTGSFSTTIWANELFDMENRAWLRLDGNYHGQFFINDINFNEVDGYWRFNVRAGLDIVEGTSIEFYVDNLTNDLSYVANAGTTNQAGVPVPARRSFTPLPSKREFGLTLKTNF